MKLANLPSGGREGALVVVLRDLTRAVSADRVAPTLQNALDLWTEVEPALRDLAHAAERGGPDSRPFDPAAALAPLPRAWQWLDRSAFPSHGQLMPKACKHPPIESDGPLMYLGLSHRFLSGSQDVALPREEDGIDRRC